MEILDIQLTNSSGRFNQYKLYVNSKMDITTDKKTRYQHFILEILQEEQTEFELQPNMRELLSIDQKNGQFLLIRLGWWQDKYIYEVRIHTELTAACKIWIHENATEILIEEALLKKGVHSSDLVLGNVHPSYRAFTDFAVA